MILFGLDQLDILRNVEVLWQRVFLPFNPVLVNIFLHCTDSEADPFVTKSCLTVFNQPLLDADLIMACSHNLISCDMEEPQIIHHDVMINFYNVAHSGW